MKFILRFVVYSCIFVVSVGSVGAVGYMKTMENTMSVYDKIPPSLQGVQTPAYDRNKPTVAVLLANEVTEVFDFLVPYQMFSMTDAYNVYAVAPDRNIKSLTGGLDVVPHYSFEEMDARLGKAPDILVIPFMPILDEKKYQPVRDWILKHSGKETTLLTICNGAENLADTGLLNGKSAATHWGDTGRLEKKYTEINWKRDQRYVPDGNIVSSAGLTSGIDATLFVISQKLGEPAAAKIAEEINYPSYDFVKNPKMNAISIEPSDSAYILDNAFQWSKKKAGVLLFNGVDESALASVFDTYSASGTTVTLTISSSNQPVVTKHHLNLIARYQIAEVPNLDKVIVAGADAKTLAADEVKRWNDTGNGAELLFLHSDSPERFAMEPALVDLSKQEGTLTAKFAAKRLEYRADMVKLEGKRLSLESVAIPLLVGLMSVLIALFIDRRFIIKKKAS